MSKTRGYNCNIEQTLPLVFGLDGVLYSMPVSDLLTFLIALYLIRGTYKELTIKEVNENV